MPKAFFAILLFLCCTKVKAGLCDEFSEAQKTGHLQSEFGKQSAYPKVYDRVLLLFKPHQQLREMHDNVMPHGDVKIIDAGGGTGLLTRHLKSSDPKRNIEIFDLSQEMTQVAKENGVSSDAIHISSITELTRSGARVADNSVDGVMTNNVIYILSMEQVHQFFIEARRVLKPGGRLSISSMKKVSKPTMDAFLSFLKLEIQKMETAGQVPVGSADVFFNSNRKLTQNAPTTFTNPEIIGVGKIHGFKPLVIDGEGYNGTAFFVAFEK